MHWNICFVSQVLKRPEYFGKFGKIHKVVINNSTSYAGSQVKLTQISAGCTSTWMEPVSHVSCCVCVFPGSQCQCLCHIRQVWRCSQSDPVCEQCHGRWQNTEGEVLSIKVRQFTDSSPAECQLTVEHILCFCAGFFRNNKVLQLFFKEHAVPQTRLHVSARAGRRSC